MGSAHLWGHHCLRPGQDHRKTRIYYTITQVDEKDCVAMMGSLANKTHQAYTAHIVIFNVEPQIRY